MQRRELFNILFKQNVSGLIHSEREPLIFTAAHLNTDIARATSSSWSIDVNNNFFLLNLSTEFAFVLTLELAAAVNDNAQITMGIRNVSDEENPLISFGIKSGCLYIGASVQEQSINKGKIEEEMLLILTVNPLSDGLTHAKLVAIDPAGLTLSVIKSREFKTTNWAGSIHAGKEFISIKMDGFNAG